MIGEKSLYRYMREAWEVMQAIDDSQVSRVPCAVCREAARHDFCLVALPP